MKSYIAHVSSRRLFRALNITSSLERPVIIQIPTQSPGRYTAELPLRRIKLFSFQGNSPYVPSTHTLWIFWGLAGWQLRLRPWRFFHVQLYVSQTSHLIYVVLWAPRVYTAPVCHQAVSHPIMNRARRCLTSVIEPITMSERRIPYNW